MSETTMMNELSHWFLPALGGVLLGTFFFAGLWWTIHKSVNAKRPALLFSISLIVRFAVVLSGFYVIGNADWQRLVACLVGFILARLILSQWLNTAPAAAPATTKEPHHAP